MTAERGWLSSLGQGTGMRIVVVLHDALALFSQLLHPRHARPLVEKGADLLPRCPGSVLLLLAAHRPQPARRVQHPPDCFFLLPPSQCLLRLCGACLRP